MLMFLIWKSNCLNFDAFKSPSRQTCHTVPSPNIPTFQHEHHLLQTTRHFFGDSSSSYASFDPAKELGVQENCKRTWADFGSIPPVKNQFHCPMLVLCVVGLVWGKLRTSNDMIITLLSVLNPQWQDPIGFWDPLGLSADKASTECLHSNSRSEMAAMMKLLRSSHEHA